MSTHEYDDWGKRYPKNSPNAEVWFKHQTAKQNLGDSSESVSVNNSTSLETVLGGVFDSMDL